MASQDLFYRLSIDAGGVHYDLSQDISSFMIEEESTRPDQLTVNLSDPYKVFSHALQEGMDIEVDLGTSDDHSLIFRGRIYKVEGDFPKAGVPRLTLRANDNSMKMGLRKRNRPWKDVTLQDIVEQTAADYPFSSIDVQVQCNPSFPGNGLRQQDETDLAFLLRLAGEYGCEMFVSPEEAGDKLHFVSQQSIMTADPSVTLYYGRCDVPGRLLTFKPSSDISSIQLPRTYSGIDYSSGQPVEMTTAQVADVSQTADPFFDENLTEFRKHSPTKVTQLEALIGASASVQEEIRTELGTAVREALPTFTTADDLQCRSQNQFSTSILGMRADGSTSGNKDLHAQASVGIEDVGGRFSGLWYLSQVTHKMDRMGYQTTFQCRR